MDVFRELAHRVDGGPAILGGAHLVDSLDAEDSRDLAVFLTGIVGVIFHDIGQQQGVRDTVRHVVEGSERMGHAVDQA